MHRPNNTVHMSNTKPTLKRRIASKLLDATMTRLFRHKPKLIDSLILPRNQGILRIYVLGKYAPRFKFVHTGERYNTIKYAQRLLTDRSPIQELATGIHDNDLHALTGCVSHRQFKGARVNAWNEDH